MSQTVTNGYAAQTIGSQLPPTAMGPRGIPYYLSFASQTIQQIDLTNAVESGNINGIQSVFVDNSTSPTWTTIVVGNSGLTIRIPAHSQGNVPLDCPNPPQLSIQNLGSASVGFLLRNYPVPSAVWNTGTA